MKHGIATSAHGARRPRCGRPLHATDPWPLEFERPGAGGGLRGRTLRQGRDQQGVTESMVNPCPVTPGSLTIWTEPVEVGTQDESNPPATVPV